MAVEFTSSWQNSVVDGAPKNCLYRGLVRSQIGNRNILMTYHNLSQTEYLHKSRALVYWMGWVAMPFDRNVRLTVSNMWRCHRSVDGNDDVLRCTNLISMIVDLERSAAFILSPGAECVHACVRVWSWFLNFTTPLHARCHMLVTEAQREEKQRNKTRHNKVFRKGDALLRKYTECLMAFAFVYCCYRFQSEPFVFKTETHKQWNMKSFGVHKNCRKFGVHCRLHLVITAFYAVVVRSKDDLQSLAILRCLRCVRNAMDTKKKEKDRVVWH